MTKKSDHFNSGEGFDMSLLEPASVICALDAWQHSYRATSTAAGQTSFPSRRVVPDPIIRATLWLTALLRIRCERYQGC
jgi:hypothetical protein